MTHAPATTSRRLRTLPPSSPCRPSTQRAASSRSGSSGSWSACERPTGHGFSMPCDCNGCGGRWRPSNGTAQPSLSVCSNYRLPSMLMALIMCGVLPLCVSPSPGGNAPCLLHLAELGKPVVQDLLAEDLHAWSGVIRGHLLPRERPSPRCEVIRAIVLEGGPCCGPGHNLHPEDGVERVEQEEQRHLRTARKGTVLATKAVGSQGKGSVLATKAVGIQGNGGVSRCSATAGST